MNATRSVVLALTALLALGVAPARPAAPPDPPPPGEKKGAPPRLPTQAEVMVAKLRHAESLVKVVTLLDYKQIGEHATALHDISRGTEFLNAHQTEEYRFQASVFQRAAATMAEQARERNAEGVMLAYLDMTKSCVRCHQTFRAPKGE